MRMVRFGAPGQERPGILDGAGAVRDCSGLIEDWKNDALGAAALGALQEMDLSALPPAAPGSRLGPPVAGVGKIVGIGLNYADHAAEAGMALLDEPVWFLKATTALSGPYDPIFIPDGGTKLDWEVELAVVIGRRIGAGNPVDPADAIAGYTIINDVSERAFQLKPGGQWTKGKSCDTFAPLGPWFVTPDEVDDPNALELWLDVNGVQQQRSSSAQMIFKPAQLIAEVSRYMTLEPGDIIATGTPSGVGYGQQPQRFLAEGDTVEAGITGLGQQRQRVERRPRTIACA